ncbi:MULTISPECIES: hypothetical protein [Streptomyces]|uniref:hypothetical protein n=1 Tax=Streptomyces TaxID=1883 RepID=UPI00343E9E27
MTGSLHHQLIEGRTDVPRIGSVIQLETQHPPYMVMDEAGDPVDPVVPYLRDLSLSDNSP